MFDKKLPSGKVRYYQKFYNEEEEKWEQVSCTLASKSRAMQAKAREILEEKIEIRLQKSDKRLSCETVKEALHE
ncbi:hypothetical protein [Streptococcus gallinaceus]|uniref:Uncharacterized protein n=1 Tax=Streptococcus gallinaceus TaxID=165758 RepID=A0ABV2JJT4_9STRE|nr:hypothetical protein [Streptococcus gallinaceus]MCP1638852.1 hypothetical protein [Streptococcus gallinaceus]MCP1769904.1 hypothetical protein [Streptococcus gallinaceus]